MSEKDQIYRDESLQADDFAFDERVVRVFPDMIRRSVPGYGLIVPSIALLARRYAQDGSNIYDLGCSLGAASFAISAAVSARDCRVIAVDNAADMIERFRNIAAERGAGPDAGTGAGAGREGVELEIVEDDIFKVHVENASVVVLNFTLQFVEPARRAELLGRIAAGMRPGGILILSEKISFRDQEEQRLQDEWHHDFKRAQGYSELEIARKRDALERTLRPETLETHIERLGEAGFSQSYRWFQCFNFTSIVAIR